MKRIGSLLTRNSSAAALLSAFALLAGPVPASGAKLDGAWVTSAGPFETFVLQERGDGRLVGYVPGDPATTVTGGLHAGSAVSIGFTTSDPGITRSGVFTGTLAGHTLSGAFDDGSGPVPVALARTGKPFTAEQWIFVETTRADQVRARRVLEQSGSFVRGGFVGLSGCAFLACGGAVTSWNVTGTAHAITTASGGTCPSASSLSGARDAGLLALKGDYSTTTCAGGSSGQFLGLKEEVAGAADIRRTLQLLAEFADLIEAESPAATDAFASSYLQDGMTKADWQALLAALYAAYNGLEARVDGVRRIAGASDPEVHPLVAAPPRVEWRLIVTGVPAPGGARVTALEVAGSLGADERLLWLGEESGRTVFVGNGQAQPFSIGMPVLAGEAVLATTGLWPFGVHGGGHPEGHPGWDVEYAPGAKVRAAANGVVSFMSPNPPDDPTSAITSVFVRHRPGYTTLYDHILALEPGIAVGAAVLDGAPIGTPGSPSTPLIKHNHFGLLLGLTATCPGNYLSAAGQAVFDPIWLTARYFEELAEPLPCNPVATTFPLTRVWLRSSGSLSVGGSLVERIEFIRPDTATSPYGYRLLGAGGSVIESGAVNLPDFSKIDLQPAGGGPAHLGIYDIVGGAMRISWDDIVRPSDLTGAAVYSLP